MRPPALSLATIAMALVTASARAEDDAPNERYQLRAELGPEIDSNAHRTEQVKASGVTNPPPVVSALARGVLSGSLSDVVADGQQVAVSMTLAGKLFEDPAARSEDVAIGESSLLWRLWFAERWMTSISGAYYEAFQRTTLAADYTSERRDFRSITGALRLSRALADHVEVGAGGGYRVFTFKPDRSYDFLSPSASLDARWARETADGAAEWELAARAGYERRAFGGKAFDDPRPTCPAGETCPPVSGPSLRVDHFFTGALDAARTGRVLVGAGYALHVNRSNSFGETVMRHFLTARFAAELPFELTLAARVELLLARYADPIIVAQTATAGRPFVSIEDENRSNARVDLSKSLTDRLALLARYTFYTNELAATDVTYRRHTALLSLSFTLEK